MNKSVMFRFKLSFPNVSRLAVHQWNYQFVETVARFISWITERLDRKLAEAIGSNIVEKVTSHYREPFNLIRRFARLMFPRIFHYLCLRLYILAMF